MKITQVRNATKSESGTEQLTRINPFIIVVPVKRHGALLTTKVNIFFQDSKLKVKPTPSVTLGNGGIDSHATPVADPVAG